MAIFRTYRNQTWDRDGNLVEDVEVQVDVTEEVNGDTIRQAAVAALAANKTFVALASPSNAQNAAQVKALTRQMNGLIRLILGQLDATD